MPTTNGHILIVEDEPVSREMLADLLQGENFEVSQAKDGAQMKSVLITSKRKVDLVLLDINLPGKDGLDLGKELHLRSDVGIIFVTGRDTPEDRIHGLDIGADDYVTKPYNPQELIARSKSVIRRSTSIGSQVDQENFTDLQALQELPEVIEFNEKVATGLIKNPPVIPDNIEELINTTGRLSYPDIKRFALHFSSYLFINILRRPVLLGLGMFAGQMRDKERNQSITKEFHMGSSEAEFELQENKAFSKTIYPFIKRQNSESPLSVYAAGRTFNNDIIIPDFAVSDRHANFFIKSNDYGISDFRSLNGTSTNGIPLDSGGNEKKIEDQTKIRIGRCFFSFLSPHSLYQELRGEAEEAT